MKKTFTALLTATVVALGSVGCKKEENVDTAALQSAFASAPDEIKQLVDSAVTAINGNDFKKAISVLDTVISKSNDLSPGQLTAAGEAFVLANHILTTRGAEISAAEAKAKASELQNQAKGSQ